MSSGVRYAIFDLDGTLLDTEPLSTVSINKVLARCNKSINWEIKSEIIGKTDQDWAKIVIERTGLVNELEVDELIQGWKRNMEELLPSVEAKPGAYELLAKLEQMDIPVALATSSSSHVLEVKRKTHEKLFNSFKVVVSGEDPELKRGKPHPDIFLLAAKRMGVEPSECVVIEDSPYGVMAGKAAGMKCVVIPDSADKRDFYQFGADEVLITLEDFDTNKWFAKTPSHISTARLG